MVAAALREVFNAEDLKDGPRAIGLGDSSGSLRTVPKVAALLSEAEEDLLAFYRFPAAHWPKLRSTQQHRASVNTRRSPVASDGRAIFPQRRLG